MLLNYLKPQHQQFLRFCSVGLLNTSVNYVVYLTLLWQHWHYLLAGGCGYLTASIVGFLLNRRWTFNTAVTLNYIFIYLLINVGSLLITLLMQWLVVEQLHISAKLSLLFAIVITTFFNFCLVKKFIFNRSLGSEKR